VPVVVQDPVWERTFPDVAGLVLPVAGEDGLVALVRLSRAETERRRRANEARFAGLVRTFDRLGLDRVILAEDRPAAVLDAFRAWAGGRTGRGRVA
jgi:hypothetical protein